MDAEFENLPVCIDSLEDEVGNDLNCSCAVAARVAANQAMILIMIENLEMKNPGLVADI